MVIKNYYKILGVEYNATESEIKSAYRRLVKKYHPDLNQGDPDAAAKFRNVQEAGETLTDAEKRVEHDYLLESKGIVTGRFDAYDEPEPEPEPEPVKQSAKPVTAAVKKPVPSAPKKPKTLAEKAAAAMAKVREAKRATRRAVMIGVSIGAVLVLLATIGIMWWQGVFTPKHTVTLHYGNGQDDVVKTVKDGDSISDPGTPGRDGYLFEGWFESETGGEKVSFPYKPKGSLTLYARWTERVIAQFTITLDYGGATGGIGAETYRVIQNGYGLGGIPVNLTRTNFDFLGWYITGTDTLAIAAGGTRPENPWSDNMALTARWETATFNIRLEWAYEQDIGTRETTVRFGEQKTLGKPGLPGSPGRNEFFEGWYVKNDINETLITDENGEMLTPCDFTAPNRSVTLTAKYSNIP